MRVVFVRHGKRQVGRRDPELTTAGRHMARETGDWIVTGQYIPNLIYTTDTNRTRQTTEAIQSSLPHFVPAEIRALPERARDWEPLMKLCADKLGGRTVLLVGHHPTTDMLLSAFPVDIPTSQLSAPVPALVRGRFASALVLEGPPWRIVDVWPGRP